MAKTTIMRAPDAELTADLDGVNNALGYGIA